MEFPENPAMNGMHISLKQHSHQRNVIPRNLRSTAYQNMSILNKINIKYKTNTRIY